MHNADLTNIYLLQYSPVTVEVALADPHTPSSPVDTVQVY